MKLYDCILYKYIKLTRFSHCLFNDHNTILVLKFPSPVRNGTVTKGSYDEECVRGVTRG